MFWVNVSIEGKEHIWDGTLHLALGTLHSEALGVFAMFSAWLRAGLSGNTCWL